MKLKFRQEGGFAGLFLGCDLDSASMSAEDAAALEALIVKSALQSLKAKGPDAARDMAGYEIVVDGPEGTVELRFDDATIPEGLDDLLEFLRERSVPQPLP